MPDLSSDPKQQLPSTLRKSARWDRLTDGEIPVMLAHPDWDSGESVPVMLWMHGRTVQKETDPGRYLRWLRSGIAACAVDLPGHGDRYDEQLQQPVNTLDIVLQMADEIDGIVAALSEIDGFDMSRIGIGGMSAGGMATLVRLCREHSFACAAVEATTGSWTHQAQREMFRARSTEELAKHNPIAHLDDWRDIPLQAIHTKADEWIAYEGQREFIDALRNRYDDPGLIEVIVYDETGAPNEHAGFGRMAADAKNKQREFLAKHLASK